MKKEIQQIERRGLPGGPNEIFTYTTGVFSTEGFRMDSPDVNNYQNIIPSGSITMKERDGSPLRKGPIHGIDNLGNEQIMYPGFDYQFPGNEVTETLLAKMGGGLLDKTIKCGNCGWQWRAADGGSDVSTCHKCGNENKIMQTGGEADFNKVKEWYNNYIDSPLYKRNLENSGYPDVDKVIEQRKSNIGKTEFLNDENKFGTYYQPNTNVIHYSPEKDSEIWSKDYDSVLPTDSVLAHEFGHAVLDNSKTFFGRQTPAYNRYDYQQLESRNKDRKISRGANENYADQKALQYEAAKLNIYKPGYEEFTKEHLEALPSDVKERALKNYSEEDLIWLMNNIAQNDNDVNNNLSLAQTGGDLYSDYNLPIAQNGTETWKKQEQSLKAEKLAKLKKLLEKDEPVFKKKTFDEKIAEKRAQENTKTVQKDNTNVRGYNKADKHSNVARNLTKSELEEKQRYEDEQIAKERQSRIDAQAKANEQPFDWSNFRQSLADRSQATGDALRVSNEPNFFDDYLNPAVMIGSMADNLGQAPLQAQQSDSYLPYITAIGTPLTVGALAGLGAQSNSQFVNNLVNPLAGLEGFALRTLPQAKNIREAIGTFAGIPTERSLPRLSPEELKIFRQVQEIGRMRSTGKPISEQYRYALNQNIPDEHFEKVFGRSKTEVEQILPSVAEQESIRSSIPIRERFNLERTPRRNSLSDQMIDVMNNSAPQQSRSNFIRHTLSGSDYENDMSYLLQDLSNNQVPPIAEEFILNTGSRRRILLPGQRQGMSLSDSFSVKNDEIQRNIYNNLQSTKNKIAAGSQNYPYYKGPVLENVPSLSLSSSGSLKGVSNKVTNQSSSGINSGDVFTGSLNTSHSSYLPQLKQVFKYEEGTPQFLGYKPMNSMGFLSDFNYSADDIAKYLNTEIDEQIKRGIIPKNVSRPYPTNKPNVNYQEVILPHYGIKQFKEGGVIYEEGGENTTTPSPLVEYVVKKGDTLSKIAAANNTSIASIMRNNESISDPNIISINQKINLVNKNVYTPKEEVYKDWNTIRDKKDKINKLSDEQKIVSYYNDKPEDTYLIVDKKNAVMKLYTGGNLTKSFEVGVGQNPGDAQTVTKVKNGKTDWSAGNKSTGAGIYTISNINPASTEYYNEPAFNLKNENGIEVATTIHGTPKPRRIKFNNGTVIDNRMSNGCINGKCEDLKELYGQLDLNTKVYILPEDEGNNFQIIDGKPALRVSSKNRQRYNQYIDQTGTKQKGQGANQTTNTLVYKPIKAYIDETKFKNDVFQWNDFNDEKEYNNTTKPFIVALTTRKQDVMKAAKISSDVYNELAKMSFGIYGAESNYGDTHSAAGNLARATNKVLDPKSSSSPDYKSKATTYGANENTRSVGLTQIRWNYLNEDEKKALKEVGITSNKDFLDPKKAAIGTVTILGVRYNQQLNDKQKQDVWKYLPTKWNSRSNYADRVKSNSSYLSFRQLDKKQEGGEFSIAQVGMEKKPFPSYKDFLASIQKDKVINYKERPREVVIESTKTIVPETPKKLTKQQAKIVQKKRYEEPFKPEGITSGDKAVDFLYNNEWLMDVPILGSYIKDKAKEIATNSGGSQTVNDINQKPVTSKYTQYDDLGYTGNFGFNQKASLLDQYFSEDALLPKSKYKPKDDYLEFLPSYSVKGYFDKDPKQITQLNELLNFNTQDSKYREFLKNKKPIYLGEGTGLPDIIGVDLGGHKTGIGWDDKMNLPYLSISDAWDFEPSNYSKKWASSGAPEAKTNQAFMQSYLMHKAGNPFKIYDRFYFDPETRQYIPDEQLGTYKKGGESKPGSLMQAYNSLLIKKKMGGAIANKKQFGGQLNSGNISMYKDYIKGIIGNEEQAIKNYDKLNRIYYSKAKELGMTAANYIMTYL